MAQKRKTKRKKKKTWWNKLLALTLLAFLCVIAAAFTPYFNLEEISIQGNETIETQLLHDMAEVEPGINIFRIKLSRIQKQIATLPYVDTVQVRRVFPNRLQIQITESKAQVMTPYLDVALLLDQNGKVLERVPMEQAVDYPAIIGLDVVDFVPGEKIITENEKKLQIVLESLREIVHNNLIGNIDEINVEDLMNVTYQMNGGKLTVRMGNAEDLAYRHRFLAQILEKLGDNPKGLLDFTAQNPTYSLKGEE